MYTPIIIQLVDPGAYFQDFKIIYGVSTKKFELNISLHMYDG